MPQRPQARLKQKRRRAKKLAEWRLKQQAEGNKTSPKPAAKKTPKAKD